MLLGMVLWKKWDNYYTFSLRKYPFTNKQNAHIRKQITDIRMIMSMGFYKIHSWQGIGNPSIQTKTNENHEKINVNDICFRHAYYSCQSSICRYQRRDEFIKSQH